MRDGVSNSSKVLVSGHVGILLVPMRLEGPVAEAYGLWIAAIASPAGEVNIRPVQISVTREDGEGKVSEESGGKEAVTAVGILGRGRTGPLRERWKHPALKTGRQHWVRRQAGVSCRLLGKSERKFRVQS
jgi:hypothetical protein